MTGRRAVTAAWVGVATAVVGWCADEPAKPDASPPPWQRLLKGEDAKKAEGLQARIGKSAARGDWAEALKVAEELRDLRAAVQGKDHWEFVSSHWDAETFRRVLARPADERRELAESNTLIGQANALEAKGDYGAAQLLRERVLATFLKLLGEDHMLIGNAHSDLAVNLRRQGRYAEAEKGHRAVLAFYRNGVGEEHPATANAHGNLADCLQHQGRHAEAEEAARLALALHRNAQGEEDPETVIALGSLAVCQQAQGRYAEAEKGLRTALALHRKVLGEDHPDTATAHNHLAANLNAQGRHAEAEQGYLAALELYRKRFGERHPYTATALTGLALNRLDQRRYAEAEEGLRTALKVFREVLGEAHPDTAVVHGNLAACLDARGKYVEAEDNYATALELARKVLGEDHLNTANALNSLAGTRSAQGRYAEAEEGFREALARHHKLLGGNHPHTAAVNTNLAYTLHARGRFAEAEEELIRAAASFDHARPRFAQTGLGRATITGARSPIPFLAGVLARNGKAGDAWRRLEEGLARGTWDDLAGRLRWPAADRGRQAELAARLDNLDRLVQRSLGAAGAKPEPDEHRKDLLAQRLEAQGELNRLGTELERKYGPAAGQVFDLAAIQTALPADAALVAWLDLDPNLPDTADSNGEHWGFVLRRDGPPVVERLRGTGPDGAWADADVKLPGELLAALLTRDGGWKPLADKLRAQRLGPLAKHLAGVKHLIVLPSSDLLRGVPVESFADDYRVSYALSGTLLAHARNRPRPDTAGLLAVADPIFDRPGESPKPKPLPPGGLLVTAVAPDSRAAKADIKTVIKTGIRAGDVLLAYAGAELKTVEDLRKPIAANEGKADVPVSLWRDGKILSGTVPGGTLDVVLDRDPAPKALADRRQRDAWLARLERGGDYPELPGTRFEAEALRRLFGGSARILADSDASEQRLAALTGELGKFRYVHFATHGVPEDNFPLRSRVILAKDVLPDPAKWTGEGLPPDGELTAEEVLRTWNLNCELVTLSACQTALGKYERGEGFVGFAQALTLAGARSVCLSLWKVDDAATALLMERFYENLLGKRDKLDKPMGKAQALAEAKAWLRDLPRDEALKRVANLSNGVERVKGRKALPPAAAKPEEPKGPKPFAHPYYWAAFVLIGDPD